MAICTFLMADLKEGDLKEGGDAGGDGGDGEAVLTSKTDDNMSSGAPWSRSSGGCSTFQGTFPPCLTLRFPHCGLAGDPHSQ